MAAVLSPTLPPSPLPLPYRTFAATFEAMEAPFFRRETTLQLPRPRLPREYVILEEFVAEEDLHRGEKKSVDAANKDDDTVCTSNLPLPSFEENPNVRRKAK